MEYFSQKSIEGFAQSVKNIQEYSVRIFANIKTIGDILNYRDTFNEMDDYEIEQEKVEIKKKSQVVNKVKVYGAGKRKTATCLCEFRQGSGRITVNKKPYLRYFLFHTERTNVIRPIAITNFSC